MRYIDTCFQSCGDGFCESGSGISPDPDREPIRIQGFDYQKLRKKQLKIFFIFFDQKLQYTHPSITDIQATGEAFTLKREHSVL